MGFTILGTGSALPERSVSNDELSEFLDTSDEWIFTRTGIKSRHVCTTESLDDLAVAASERALQVSGIDASQLDLIVCSTTTGDHLVPAEACAVAERLGATCPAFDVSAAPLIEKYFGSERFALVQGHVDAFPPKPEAPVTLHVMKELGADPATTLYVGDSNVDILTGHNAGLKSAGVSWGFRGRAELEATGADYVVDTQAELAALVLGE